MPAKNLLMIVGDFVEDYEGTLRTTSFLFIYVPSYGSIPNAPPHRT